MLQKYLNDCEEYDGEFSEYSETTLASEVVERQIDLYKRNEPPNSSNNSDRIQVVNFRVDSVNIYGENEGEFSNVWYFLQSKLYLFFQQTKAMIQFL